ncbi:MAG TPA: ribose 5-phosphate isomerase B [Bacteroidetes bacterium]|nr:ribose 5-phosphate isomerase B [Bacteroidota bacterium]HCN38136.1 ribose 5-phosphate isomerase B [Bacteroidota bacterium]
MNIAIGSDHRGFNLKNELIEHLKAKGYIVKDFGSFTPDSVDYPDYTKLVGASVSSGESDYGVLMCGSGIGVSIAANKSKGIRAVNACSPEIARMSRLHNNANVICFGADFIKFDEAVLSLEAFLNTEFEGGRHQRRVEKISEIENNK